MNRVLASLLLVAISACSPSATPGPTSTAPPSAAGSQPPVASGAPNPTAEGAAEDLVKDLQDAGAAARLGSFFLAEPLPGEGILVCVGTEAVQVYVLRDQASALEAASRIDRDDPSKVGNAIVDWAGRPRFWLRDRIIVLYVGSDPATDTALRSLLGIPFAEGRLAGRPPLPAPDCA